jgi:hypothetical protein
MHTDALKCLSDADLIAQVKTFEWANLNDLHAQALPFLVELGERKHLLRRMLDNLRADSGLFELCELLPDMYKYTLYQDSTGARIRLHIFRPEYEDVPHSHRWALASYIIHGAVVCRYYGSEINVQKTYSGRMPLPLVTKTLQAGSFYTIVDTTLHWFHGEPGSVSLVVRGPLAKDVSHEFGEGGVNLKYGAQAKMETPANMQHQDYLDGISMLEGWGVL